MNDKERAVQTYLTTEELASRIHYDVRTIRNRLKDSVLLEGTHYIRPFGGRKLLFLWEAIERDIGNASASRAPLTVSCWPAGPPMTARCSALRCSAPQASRPGN